MLQTRFIRNETQLKDNYSRGMHLATPILVGICLIESIRVVCDQIRKNNKKYYKMYIAPYLFNYLDLIDTKNEY